MKRSIFILTTAIACSLLSSCFTNPVTGRKSLNAVPEGEMRSLSTTQYTQFLQSSSAINVTSEAEMVKRIGAKMSTAVQQYLASIGKADLVSGYQWEFNLVNNKEVNAWCMPGGKVVVYSGILPISQTEAGLATIMGHEIAHAVARHSNERMSQQLAGEALSSLISSNSAKAGQFFNLAVGLGGLKFSRDQESEADEMGLYFMAMAGYNPEEAVSFWQRMSAQGTNKGWEFLSTHPGDQTRINNINKLLPKAKQYYKPQ